MAANTRLFGVAGLPLEWCFAPDTQKLRTEDGFREGSGARGLNCPLPILRAKKALADMQPNQVLRVVATDPGAVKDFQAFAKQTGNELLKHDETADKAFEFFLKRK